jgi:heat shock protein HslJ
MIGTRMMCPPALMTQEDAYRKLVETAQSFCHAGRMLIVTSAGGATSRFARK